MSDGHASPCFDPLGECAEDGPCVPMRGALKSGTVVRDVNGALRFATGIPVFSCPWCAAAIHMDVQAPLTWHWRYLKNEDPSDP